VGGATSTFDLTCSIELQGTAFPMVVAAGQQVSFRRTITASSTPPPGTVVSYHVVLSTVPIVGDGQGIVIASGTATQLGTTVVQRATVPTTVATGVYYLGILVSSVPADSVASNNTAVDGMAGHTIEVLGGGISRIACSFAGGMRAGTNHAPLAAFLLALLAARFRRHGGCNPDRKGARSERPEAAGRPTETTKRPAS
jgi:hypothetical protein